MIDFDNDPINLSIAAALMAQKFYDLDRIGDTYFKELWHGYVAPQVLVPAFWPYLEKALDAKHEYRICKAEFEYSAVEDRVDDPEYIYATGIRVTLITDREMKQIQDDNERRKHAAE